MQVSNIFRSTAIKLSFSQAAATLSLSFNCLFTWSAVLCVPSLILTSSLNRGGSACSKRTLIPKPITVARLQWVIVGVISTNTCDIAERFGLSVTFMCGRLTTASSPRLRGCSGSEMVDIRSTSLSRLALITQVCVRPNDHKSIVWLRFQNCTYMDIENMKEHVNSNCANLQGRTWVPSYSRRYEAMGPNFRFFNANASCGSWLPCHSWDSLHYTTVRGQGQKLWV